jgi:hypothetical protein
MSKILKQVAAALLLLATDPCLGQPLVPSVKAGPGAGALVSENSKESGNVASTTATLISILESAPAGGGYNGIIGPLSAGSAAGTAVASRVRMPGTSAYGVLVIVNGVAVVAITTSTAGISVATANTQ